MKKRILISCLCVGVIVLSIGITVMAHKGRTNQNITQNDSVTSNTISADNKISPSESVEFLNAVINDDKIVQSVSEKLKQDKLSLSQQGFSNSLRDTVGDEITIDENTKKHLEYILTAKEFLEQAEKQSASGSEQQNIELRDQCNQIFDTIEKLSASVSENSKLSADQQYFLRSMYSELAGKEWLLKNKFPTDYDREFQKNVQLTKDCICTEYLTIPRLEKYGPSYIQKIDNIVEKVETGALTSQQGYDEVEKIWNEWKQL